MKNKPGRFCIILFLTAIFTIPGMAISQENLGIHKQVDELVLASDLKKAEEIAAQAYEKNPEDPETICALACVYRNQAYKRIIKIETSATGIKQGKRRTINLMADDANSLSIPEYYYDKEIYKKAEVLYYRIIETDPSYVVAYFNLLNDYIAMETFDPFFKVTNLFMNNLKGKKDTPYQLLDIAEKIYKEQLYDQAEKLYKIILSAYPEFSYVKSDLGTLYIQKGRIVGARNLFDEVYNANPRDSKNLNTYLTTLLLNEDFEISYTIALQLSALNPEDFYHHYMAGVIAFYLEKDFSKHFKTAVKIREDAGHTGEKDFWIHSGNLFLSFKKESGKEQDALLEFLMFKFNDNNFNNLCIVTANIINKRGATNYSLLILCSIYDGYHFHEKILNYLDRINERKKTDDSIMNSFDLKYSYGRAYFFAKDYKKARSYLLENFKVDSKVPQNNYLLAQTCLALDMTDDAKKYLRINSALDNSEEVQYKNLSIEMLDKIN
jgi:tetratricopeptide (TPR) repeat protein